MNIKATIGIIIIALSSVSMAEAGQKHHERDNERLDDRGHYRQYDTPHHERNFRKYNQHKQWRHAKRHRQIRREVRRELRHERQQRRFNRHMRKYIRAHRRYYHWNNDWRYERSHFYRHSSYIAPDYYAVPRYRSRVVISSGHHSDNVLPILAGGLIGSAIASDASGGDAGAAFGGAIFGAMVGNAISQH